MLNNLTTSLAIASGLAGASYIAWRLHRHLHQNVLPTEWREVGVLEDLLAYPIKSCQWVQLKQAECTKMGLRSGWLRDRTLMVIDKKRNFVSARAFPEMLRVCVSFQGSIITLSHPNMESVTFDLAETERVSTESAIVWSTPVKVKSCGWETSEWFSRLLNKDADSLGLVFYCSDRCRKLRSTANPIYHFQVEDTGALPDETSFNMINKASIEDLNERLDGRAECVPRQFRPNFVVKGARPLEEDEWKFVRIGENVFEVIKPCFRCVMTTINPSTALKNANGEPLRTLKGYRQLTDPAVRKSAGSSPWMGLQLALRSPPGGVVHVGDVICVA